MKQKLVTIKGTSEHVELKINDLLRRGYRISSLSVVSVNEPRVVKGHVFNDVIAFMLAENPLYDEDEEINDYDES